MSRMHLEQVLDASAADLAEQSGESVSNLTTGADPQVSGFVVTPLTLAELNAQIEMLSAQIATNMCAHHALTELLDLARASGATDHSGVLECISAAQPKPAEVA